MEVLPIVGLLPVICELLLSIDSALALTERRFVLFVLVPKMNLTRTKKGNSKQRLRIIETKRVRPRLPKYAWSTLNFDRVSGAREIPLL